ncbi:MAG: tetratricopeptide repeat protein, partial [Cyanobacteria bacterium P01_D01_bin.156]
RAGEANTLGNIGIIYDLLGDYPQALDYQEQSLALKRELGDRAGEANTLGNIGIIYRLLGDYPQALDYYDQSLALKRELGNRAGEAITLGNIGIIYEKLGDYTQALDYYDQSLALKRELGNRAGEAITLGNIGNIYQLLGDYPQALDYYDQSLALKRELGNRAGEAITLLNIASVNYFLDQNDQALSGYQQSLSIKQEIGDYTGQALALWGISLIYERSQDYTKAISTYQQALAISRAVGAQPTEAALLNRLGFVFGQQEQSELAIIFYKEAVNIYEEIRAGNRSLEQSLQDSYTSNIEFTYRQLADLLLQQERILEAQRVMDLLKVQELDNYLRGVRSSANSRAGAELVPPETIIATAHATLIDRAITNGKRLNELETKPTLTDAELDELVGLQAEQQQILQAFNTFQDSSPIKAQIEKLSPEERDRNVKLSELPALQDNLGQIPQGAVLLYPLILNNKLELIVTSPYAPPINRTVDVSLDQLIDAVDAFRYALDDPTRDAVTPAQQLYEWLIAPIENDLQAAGVNTLIYAPDRILRYIPLAALHDGENWLAERYRINHITAASLTDLNTPNRNDPKILAGALTDEAVTINVGDNAYNFPSLDHVDDEVNAIAALSPTATSLLDSDFNRALIEREANRHNILHLATHAKFLVGQPEDSFILFNNKERWTLGEFNQGLLNLTRVDLVVLSACETGVDNTFGNGEEILGFGHLMQTAGARASMASLWAVDDGGTQLLMGEFYEALIKGNLSKTAALQQAQLSLININENRDRGGLELAESIGLDPTDLSHPYYWAPFILIGNGL